MLEHEAAVEVFYDGAWHPADVRDDTTITVRRGQESASDGLTPSLSSPKLANPDGLWAPKSITSPLYGKLGPNTPGRVTLDGDVRLTGEVALWKPQRPTKGQPFTETEIGGTLRRLGRAADDFASPMRRAVERGTVQPVAYYPLDEAQGTALAAVVDAISGSAIVVSPTSQLDADTAGLPKSGAADGAPVSGPMLGISGGYSIEFPIVANPAGDGITFSGMWYFGDRAFEAGDTSTNFVLVQNIYSRPTHLEWFVSIQTDSTGMSLGQSRIQLFVFEYNQTRTTVINAEELVNFGSGDTFWPMTQKATFRLVLVPNGGTNIDWYFNVGFSPDFGTVSDSGTYAPSFSGAMSAAPYRMIVLSSVAANNIAAIGHVAAYNTKGDPDDFENLGPLPYRGWDFEPTTERFIRLLTEEGYECEVVGGNASLHYTLMGPQGTDPLASQLEEIMRTDDALIYEDRSSRKLWLLPGYLRRNVVPALTLSYLGDVVPPLRPDFGDGYIHNDVTASTPQNLSVRARQLTGPHNIQLPEDDPQGVGRYPITLRVNVASQSSISIIGAAEWAVHLGTYDGTVYPAVEIDLNANPDLTEVVNALEIGDVVRLVDLPVEDSARDFYGQIVGMLDKAPNKMRTVVLYLVPAEPYNVGAFADDEGEDALPFDASFAEDEAADSSELVLPVAPGDTHWLVRSRGATPWTQDADDFPLVVQLGPRQSTVTSISEAVNDGFDRTVSNGLGSEPVSGEAYTLVGSASDFAVSAGNATVAMSGAANTFKGMVLLVGTSHKSVAAKISLNVNSAGGATITQWLCGRWLDSNNYYVTRLDVTTAGVVTLILGKRVNGSFSSLGQVNVGSGHTSGAAWWIELDAYGSSLEAYAWQGNYSDKPTTAQLSATDGAIPSGTRFGLLFRRETGNTDTTLVASIGDFVVADPQRFTVDQAEPYAIPAGIDVSVAQPMIFTR